MADVPAFPGFPGSPSSPSTPSTPSGGVTPVFPPAVPYINTAPAAAHGFKIAPPTPLPRARPSTRWSASLRIRPMPKGRRLPIRWSADTSGGGFKIDPATGVVTVADSSKINFETARRSRLHHHGECRATALPSSAQNFTIAVSDVAPSTPVDSNAAANAVAEGAANGSTVSITASSTDVNGPA